MLLPPQLVGHDQNYDIELAGTRGMVARSTDRQSVLRQSLVMCTKCKLTPTLTAKYTVYYLTVTLFKKSRYKIILPRGGAAEY